jgi:hypothetical protein
MDLSDDEVQQRAAADRRAVDPPIRVETAAWSKAARENVIFLGLSGTGMHCAFLSQG